MKKPKSKVNVKSSLKLMRVKTGTVEDFFSNVKGIMRTADKGEPLKKRAASLTFVDPTEMLHFLSAAKIKLINSIRKHPDTITNIAKVIKRNRASVYRDINELEKFGLVKTHEEINPGHGRHKIVELVAPILKLEAYI
jgi:predicted transcriptional regulator